MARAHPRPRPPTVERLGYFPEHFLLCGSLRPVDRATEPWRRDSHFDPTGRWFRVQFTNNIAQYELAGSNRTRPLLLLLTGGQGFEPPLRKDRCDATFVLFLKLSAASEPS